MTIQADDNLFSSERVKDHYIIISITFFHYLKLRCSETPDVDKTEGNNNIQFYYKEKKNTLEMGSTQKY